VPLFFSSSEDKSGTFSYQSVAPTHTWSRACEHIPLFSHRPCSPLVKGQELPFANVMNIFFGVVARQDTFPFPCTMRYGKSLFSQIRRQRIQVRVVSPFSFSFFLCPPPVHPSFSTRASGRFLLWKTGLRSFPFRFRLFFPFSDLFFPFLSQRKKILRGTPLFSPPLIPSPRRSFFLFTPSFTASAFPFFSGSIKVGSSPG